ncbi:hypothetical protein EON81_05715 [bacterium]|nr:MAG: hypothetical protein EON81_05715 [bacterium]
MNANLIQSSRNVVRTNGVSVPTSVAKIARNPSGQGYGTLYVTPKGGTIYFKMGSTFSGGSEVTPTITASDYDEMQPVNSGPIRIPVYSSVSIWWVATAGGVTADIVEGE